MHTHTSMRGPLDPMPGAAVLSQRNSRSGAELFQAAAARLN